MEKRGQAIAPFQRARLLKITLQQALQRLAVTGLVAGHLHQSLRFAHDCGVDEKCCDRCSSKKIISYSEQIAIIFLTSFLNLSYHNGTFSVMISRSNIPFIINQNEDELWSNYISGGYSNTIKDGKAEWLGEMGTPNGWSKTDVASVAFIEIYGYTNTLHGSPDYEFENYITIDVREFFDWNDIK